MGRLMRVVQGDARASRRPRNTITQYTVHVQKGVSNAPACCRMLLPRGSYFDADYAG